MKAARYWHIERDEVVISIMDTERNDRSRQSLGMGFRIRKVEQPEMFRYFEALEASFKDS